MKILHTADWHIGSFKGPEQDGVNLRSMDTLKCLEEVVRVAEDELPDLILVSGDIFHQAEIWQSRSHKEVLQARDIIMRLSKTCGTIVVMRGTPNHDSEDAFEELKAHFELIDNAYIVTDPQVVHTKYADIIAVPGFDKGRFRAKFPGLSKDEENMVFSDELGNIVVGMKSLCEPGKLSILMSHYTVPGANTESGQVQLLTQVEPVITQEMLISANYDLVALGHIHRPQFITGIDNVCYSGAVNALNFNDEGQERGFWIHHFEDGAFGNTGKVFTDSQFFKTPSREFLTITWSPKDVAEAIGNPETLAMKFMEAGVADKIVRIIYRCTSEQKKAINTAQIEKALYEAGAFWKADIKLDSIEDVNRTELSKFDDPETNLTQYLQEKGKMPEEITQILEAARPIIEKARANEAVSEFTGTFIPKEISVKNYRNYVEQSFSFEDIRFCTINGQNGAGKSSLFMDAIMDCLFEEPREGDLTGWIRSDEKARSGSISFTFSLGENTFRVVRTRAKSGKGTLNLSQLINGEWEDRSKEKYKDTQNEIEKVLGMDSLTFKACVLIMQDQYGLFLEAGKEERVGVLSNLLGLGIYSVMEDLAKDNLSVLRRDIAAKKNTVNIHEQTINGYGDPLAEKTIVENSISAHQDRINELTKERDEKSVILNMQNEAEERRKKVQTSIVSLESKVSECQTNIAALSSTITTCDTTLQSESDTLQKVEEYNALVEKDKGLSEKAAVHASKVDELNRLRVQIADETASISKHEADLDQKNRELSSLQDNANDYVIRTNAAEYMSQDKLLNVEYEKERDYRAKELEKQKVSNSIAELQNLFSVSKKGLERDEENHRRKAQLLDSVQCVDIENANCGFLADALASKKKLDEYPDMLKKLEEDYQAKVKPLEDHLEKLDSELQGIGFNPENIAKIKTRIEELRPYVDQLEELNQRESRIELVKASIEHIQSNIAEAQKRLSTVKIKAQEIEEILPEYTDAVTAHRETLAEINRLKAYVDLAGTYPVVRERKANAEQQKADYSIRLTELLRELEDAKAELEKTGGATLDITSLQMQIDSMNSQIKQHTDIMNSHQQELGGLNQKIEEIKRLKLAVSELQTSISGVSAEISKYDLLKSAFSQDGIPHQIIRSLVPKLTEVSSSILGQMTGGKMGIEFQTEKTIKSNTNKEVVTLDILIEEYGKSTLPYLSKSGGEKVKASLSVILALAEIKASSAGIQMGMLFIDEPPFLDADGIQAYCDALETIQYRYPTLKIMAITHDPTMKARFPQSLDVIKTEDGSKVIYE